jgi:glycosyltransferase involved in cell wall biosynthesis
MDLSILIPARNEEFLKNTIEDILAHIEADTEIIAFLDGQWVEPPIEDHPRVHLIYSNKVVGQREGTNIAARLSKAKYVMKMDAHCSFDQGFDRKMLEAFAETGDEVVMVPVMRNLHAYDWKCTKCGKRRYQDDFVEVCPEQNYKGTGKPCGGTEFKKKLLWIGKERPQSVSYCFNASPQFKYFGEYTKTKEYKEALKKTGITETMSLQGSAFMITRENYWKLNICDSSLGNWGNQGIEVACKAWLSGRRVLVNHRTWYAHMFRTKPKFSFPWPVSGSDQKKTKEMVKNQIYSGQINEQKHKVSWLVEKFWPIPGWTETDLEELKRIEK